jgi:hypothetical protein
MEVLAVDANLWHEQDHECYEQQHAARLRELHHHRPEEPARHPPEALSARLAFAQPRLQFLRLEPITGDRLGAKLLPKLLDRYPIADPLPEITDSADHSAQVYDLALRMAGFRNAKGLRTISAGRISSRRFAPWGDTPLQRNRRR